MTRTSRDRVARSRRLQSDGAGGVGPNRLRLIAAVGAIAWVALAARLVQVQGFHHPEYVQQARAQQERWIDVEPRRGSILDRRGRQLAVDVQSASFYCDPADLRDRGVVARFFSDVAGTADLRDRLASSRSFVYLARQVRSPQLEAVRQSGFAGVLEQPEWSRYYPFGGLAGQILGFTDVDNVGREGVELALEERLAGEAGREHIWVDAHGRTLPERRKVQEPARDGCTVRLTIDASYQGILEEELVKAVRHSESDGGLGLITDPRTGKILAVASVPLFDPNEPGDYRPGHRRNRTITDPFEPGSTFKAISAAAILEEGVATTNTSVYCENGAFVLSTGDTIRDVSPHGELTVRQVLKHSSNIGIMKLTSKIERGDFYNYLRQFGFGTRTGIGLPAESSGLLHHVSTWSDRSLETISIGQEISVTALQLVQAFGAIANGGVLMAPLVVEDITDPQGTVVERSEPRALRRVVSRETVAHVRSMLTDVVSTGSGRRAAMDGIEVAGKTGTAQRAGADGSGYKAGELVASFVGFLPADDPKLLCLVVVDNPKRDKWGGHVAAPAFKKIMERIILLGENEISTGGFARANPPGRSPRTRRALPGPWDWALSRMAEGLVTSVPDFRGMTTRKARYQGELRGMTVHFEGAGDVVVGQTPPPGSLVASQSLACKLGSAESVEGDGLLAMPLRQTLLLRKLGGQMLAALGAR